MTHYLIFGASRGLGAALGRALPQPGDGAWLVSRHAPPYVDLADGARRVWLPGDLSHPDTPAQVAAQLGHAALDVLIYNAGIWEPTAFGPDYDFAHTDPADNARIIQVNLTAAMACVQACLPHLGRARHAKIILVGSISGLENTPSVEVAYAASKFGLRGVAHTLRHALRPHGMAVTCLNLGSFDAEANPPEASPLPLADILTMVRAVLALSPQACPTRIDLPAMTDAA